MAAAPKKLGAISPDAATATDVFGPLTTGAVFSLQIFNGNAATATLKVSLSDTTATQAAAAYLLNDYELASGQFINLTGLACDTEYLVAESDVVTVNFVAMGVEV